MSCSDDLPPRSTATRSLSAHGGGGGGDGTQSADDDRDRRALGRLGAAGRALREHDPVEARVAHVLLLDGHLEAGALQRRSRRVLVLARHVRDGRLLRALGDAERDRRARRGSAARLLGDDRVLRLVAVDVDPLHAEPLALQRRARLVVGQADDVGDGDRLRAGGDVDLHGRARASPSCPRAGTGR